MTKLLILLLLGTINTADARSSRTKHKNNQNVQRHHNNVQRHNNAQPRHVQPRHNNVQPRHNNYHVPKNVSVYWYGSYMRYRHAGLVWQWVPGYWIPGYWIPGHWVIIARF